jgi:hypothetical protein
MMHLHQYGLRPQFVYEVVVTVSPRDEQRRVTAA